MVNLRKYCHNIGTQRRRRREEQQQQQLSSHPVAQGYKCSDTLVMSLAANNVLFISFHFPTSQVLANFCTQEGQLHTFSRAFSLCMGYGSFYNFFLADIHSFFSIFCLNSHLKEYWETTNMTYSMAFQRDVKSRQKQQNLNSFQKHCQNRDWGCGVFAKAKHR